MNGGMSERKRCPWVNLENPLYVSYHDEEWGRPVHDDQKHFELLLLEGAQAGLSWETILKKREGYREAFADFDPQKVAKFTKKKVASLLENPDIVRNRMKISAAVSNAKAFLKLQKKHGTFDKFVWSFVDGVPRVNRLRQLEDYPSSSPESDALSVALKEAGFRFVGSTIAYAYMQAAGLVDDHTMGCWVRRARAGRDVGE
jgi:DNA-3-methyladenine glycosylase I